MLSRRAYDLCAAALIALALSISLAGVSGLTWPYDGDHFRDIAQAQTTRDGHPLADPFYAGEWFWYNPLVPWLIAAVSYFSGQPPALVHVQGGPWLNLLGPIAFYLLCARLVGRAAGVIALALLLFVNCGHDPSLTCATYSPWLFVATFAQGLFFLGVIALDVAASRRTDATALVAGAVAGLTFLAHTAPALVLAGIAVFTLRPRQLGLSGVAALVVASPFLWSIVLHYHLHIVNSTPMAWTWLPLTLAGFPETLAANAWLLAGGVAGAFVARKRVLLAWAVSAVLMLGYGLTRDAMPSLPVIVPTFHFWRYVMAAATLLAGAALAWTARRVCGRWAVVVIAIGVAATVYGMLPRYRSRFDFAYGRSVAQGRSADLSAAATFLHKSTPPDAVVLGSRGLTLEVIAPAGRHVVAVNANWSNPYVDNAPRVAARDGMLTDLAAGRIDDFQRLADRYGVTHAVGMGQPECDAMRAAGLQLLYRFGEVCVLSRSLDPVR